jgi:hypothetical protein
MGLSKTLNKEEPAFTTSLVLSSCAFQLHYLQGTYFPPVAKELENPNTLKQLGIFKLSSQMNYGAGQRSTRSKSE